MPVPDALKETIKPNPNMKRILFTFVFAALGLGMAKGQGIVVFYNLNSLYRVSTNSGDVMPAIGPMATNANQFYFTLLTASSDPGTANPLDGWGQALQMDGSTPIMATNTSFIAGGIQGAGGPAGVAVYNWTPGASLYIEIVGWSASLGTSWTDIQFQLLYGWQNAGYFGVSNYGYIASGGYGTPASPGASLFQPAGISSGWLLSRVQPVPEPSILALAALGLLSLGVIFRRK